MRRMRVVAMTFVSILAIALILPIVPGSQLLANQKCKVLRGFIQGSLPTQNQFAPTDTWGGPVFFNFDGSFLQGGLSGNDGTEYSRGPGSIFKNGEYRLCLTSAPAWGGPSDCADSVSYKVPQAVVIWPAGDVPGSYRAIVNIAKGSNRFASASGQLEVTGTFVVWEDKNSPFGVSGRWNGEISGLVCGVQ